MGVERTDSPHAGQHVSCPRCAHQTDRIQAYQVPIWRIGGYFNVLEYEWVIGCPACVQARLWQLMGETVLDSNVLYPFAALKYYSLVRASRRDDRPGIPEWFTAKPPAREEKLEYEYADVARPAEEPEPIRPASGRPKLVPLLIGLVVLACMIGFVFFILPGLMQR
jgi:hypothetical protein